MSRKKVGLVLGSGGARGLAHIGVIKGLLKHGVKIDIIAGSSAGALIGGLFAAKGNIEDIEKMANSLNYKDLLGIFSDPVWGMGLIKGQKALEYLRKYIGDVKIEDLAMPFAAVATDINTAETVVLSKGELANAIRASGSIPLVFEPYKAGERLLVDGGVSSPVPVDIARNMGADVIIAVNLDSVYFLQDNRKEIGSSKTEVFKNSYFLLRYHLAKKEVRDADIVIEPQIPYVNDLAFVHGENLIQGGLMAVEKEIEKIRRLTSS